MSTSNDKPIHPTLPPDALELLQDPRLDGMIDSPGNFRPATRVLRPEHIERSESAYLHLCESLGAEPNRNARWVNEPGHTDDIGLGLGFDRLTERPRFEQASEAPQRLFHLWRFGSQYVASPDIVELLSKEDPAAIATLPIDWIFQRWAMPRRLCVSRHRAAIPRV